MRIGRAYIDFDALLVEGPSGPMTMEPIVMQLLRVLADNPYIVMSREELITTVWGVEYGGDERLSRAVSLLRKALGDTKAPRQYIETISRRGYRLIAEVEAAENIIVPQSGAVVPAQSENADNVVNMSALAARPIVFDAAAGEMVEAEVNLRASKPAFSFKRWASVAALSLAAIAAISFSVTAISPRLSVPVNARIDDGLYYVEHYYEDDAIERAQDIFNAVLAKDPDHAAARAGLAIILIRKHLWVESDPATIQLAAAHAEAALRADEHLALSNIARAWIYQLSNEADLAHELLDRADILDANNKLGIEVRARVFGRQRQADNMQKTLEHGIKTYPNSQNFHALYGRFLERQNDFKGAEAAFRKTIGLSPDNSNAYAQLSHVLHMQNKTDEAVKVVQDGLKVRENSLLYSNLGAYLFFQGHYDLAASAFEKTLEIDGNTHNYIYWSNLADSYRWLPGRKDDAEIAYKRAIQLINNELERVPDSPDFNTRSAVYHAKLGDFEGAQLALSNLVFSGGVPPVHYYRTAVAYEIMANRPKALEFLRQSIDAGYPMNEILNDPELTELRQDIAYHKLLARN